MHREARGGARTCRKYCNNTAGLGPVRAGRKKTKRRTHEFAVVPKYFAPPERLMESEPKASTTSGLCSSSFITLPVAWLRKAGTSRWRGAFMRRSSSESNGCCSLDRWEWEERRASSSSRTRFASSEIFSWSSWVDARTNLGHECSLQTTKRGSDSHRLPCPVVREPY